MMSEQEKPKRTPPAWTEATKNERAAGKVAHVIALWLLRDKIDLTNKSATAKRLGISRWTLDRYLATLQEAEPMAEVLLKKYQDFIE